MEMRDTIEDLLPQFEKWSETARGICQARAREFEAQKVKRDELMTAFENSKNKSRHGGVEGILRRYFNCLFGGLLI